MNKLCIFDREKNCSNCGECDACDLNSRKKCNNCGKCLELEGYDIKAIKIDEVLESNEEVLEYEQLNKLHEDANKAIDEDEFFWEYIDDIKELRNFDERDRDLGEDFIEEFPGLISFKK